MMIPGMALNDALKFAKKTAPEWEKLVNEVLSQFGLDESSHYSGLAPLILASIGPVTEIVGFLKDLHILEVQVMKYLDMLGADLETAKKTVQNPIGGFAFGGPKP